MQIPTWNTSGVEEVTCQNDISGSELDLSSSTSAQTNKWLHLVEKAFRDVNKSLIIKEKTSVSQNSKKIAEMVKIYPTMMLFEYKPAITGSQKDELPS